MINAAKGSTSKYKAALQRKGSYKKVVSDSKAEDKFDEKNLKREVKAAEKLLEEGKESLNKALKRKNMADASVASDIIDVSTKEIKKMHAQLEQSRQVNHKLFMSSVHFKYLLLYSIVYTCYKKEQCFNFDFLTM